MKPMHSVIPEVILSSHIPLFEALKLATFESLNSHWLRRVLSPLPPSVGMIAQTPTNFPI